MPRKTRKIKQKGGADVFPKRPLTILGTLLDIYNKPITKLSVFPDSVDKNSMKVFGMYEARLTQAAYFSRLAYTNNEVILGCLHSINSNPLVFNTALSIVDALYKQKKLPTTVALQPFMGIGTMLINKHQEPCHMQLIDYSNIATGCPYPGKKVLYITFRGTNNLKAAITDAKVAWRKLEDAFASPRMFGASGTEVFAQEFGQKRSGINYSGVNPFGGHRGFISNVRHVLDKVCSEIETRFAPAGFDTIVVTGHSLGGANASLAAMLLGGFKKFFATNGIKNVFASATLHCITFGAPALFTAYSRDVFNKMLIDGHLSLDRVTNRVRYMSEPGLVPGAKMDLVPYIAAFFFSPGFSIGHGEFYPVARTGRSKDITEVRKLFTGMRRDKSWFGASQKFNEIPTYPEFLECFDPLLADVYGKLILKNSFGTVYQTFNPAENTRVDLFVKKGLNIPATTVVVVEQPTQDPTEVTEIAEVAEVTQTAVEAVTSESAQAQTADAAEPGASDPVTQAGGAWSLFGTPAPTPTPTPTPLTQTQTPSDEGFKQLAKQYGSNQVVYRPQLNIASLSAHLAYMGVSYMGVLSHAGIFLKRYEDDFAIENGVMYLKEDPKKALNRINRKPSNTKLALYNLRSTIRNLSPEPVELLKGIPNSRNSVPEDQLARNRRTRTMKYRS
jgi:hypothetical protein